MIINFCERYNQDAVFPKWITDYLYLACSKAIQCKTVSDFLNAFGHKHSQFTIRLKSMQKTFVIENILKLQQILKIKPLELIYKIVQCNYNITFSDDKKIISVKDIFKNNTNLLHKELRHKINTLAKEYHSTSLIKKYYPKFIAELKDNKIFSNELERKARQKHKEEFQYPIFCECILLINRYRKHLEQVIKSQDNKFNERKKAKQELDILSKIEMITIHKNHCQSSIA